MKPSNDPTVTVIHGDALATLRAMDDHCIDVVITDPPYGLSDIPQRKVVEVLGHWLGGEREYIPRGGGMMGRSWDAFVPPPAVWDECVRVLKPGGMMAVFASSRTVDLMALSMRLAGFEIRDQIAWIGAQGMPKGVNLERTTGDERFAGWNSSLKPALEPIIIARAPMSGSLTKNVMEHGVGGYHIDACRTDAMSRPQQEIDPKPTGSTVYAGRVDGSFPGGSRATGFTNLGRWPTNVVFSHTPMCIQREDRDVASNSHHPARRGSGGIGVSGHGGQDHLVERNQRTEVVTDFDCVEGCPVHELNASVGVRTSGANPVRRGDRIFGHIYGEFVATKPPVRHRDTETGYASRYFPTFVYEPKAPTSERPEVDGIQHISVKPLALMRWLARLLTPQGGLILEPFAGSGTTAQAALLEGFSCVAIEAEEDHCKLIEKRLGDFDQPVARAGHEV